MKFWCKILFWSQFFCEAVGMDFVIFSCFQVANHSILRDTIPHLEILKFNQVPCMCTALEKSRLIPRIGLIPLHIFKLSPSRSKWPNRFSIDCKWELAMGLSHLDAVPFIQCVQNLVCVRSGYWLNIFMSLLTIQNQCKKVCFSQTYISKFQKQCMWW